MIGDPRSRYWFNDSDCSDEGVADDFETDLIVDDDPEPYEVLRFIKSRLEIEI